ncbi:uncharacterized protein BJ212DRAFT_1500367 [Suillus subaureus]|uniref:Uncharacterized protein n=1 Tax=Suillus subaureus TaxID=48587 RepID=A0A9P7ED77_9AGAM|nr:uncharacterized protein BJ212DRAFT_1500367 [Suillus subaureus]KAG1817730.1 hypothetical protein BJ212DRAFT_1500367 [Suillus subaureus]
MQYQKNTKNHPKPAQLWAFHDVPRVGIGSNFLPVSVTEQIFSVDVGVWDSRCVWTQYIRDSHDAQAHPTLHFRNTSHITHTHPSHDVGLPGLPLCEGSKISDLIYMRTHGLPGLSPCEGLQTSDLICMPIHLSLTVAFQDSHRVGAQQCQTSSACTYNSRYVGSITQITLPCIIHTDSETMRNRKIKTFYIRCIQGKCFMRGYRYSILPILTLDGIIAYDIIEGPASVN